MSDTLWPKWTVALDSSSVQGDSPSKNTGVGCHFLLQGIFLIQGLNLGLLHCRCTLDCLSHQGSPPGDLSNPGIKSRFPALQVESLLSEPPGRPKNTRMGSLALQGILLTQEWNQGLLHCRWVLYHLSYLGSPLSEDTFIKTTFSGLKEWEYWQNRRIFKRVSY